MPCLQRRNGLGGFVRECAAATIAGNSFGQPPTFTNELSP